MNDPTPHPADSPAIAAAKQKANATEYVKRYGADETYWTHFLASDAPAADWRVALELIERTAPEATRFIAHLQAMANIKSFSAEDALGVALEVETARLAAAITPPRAVIVRDILLASGPRELVPSAMHAIYVALTS